MNDWELAEELQLRQQRFEAALKFIQIKMEEGDGKQLIGEAVDESIALADLLLNTLETNPRRGWDKDTPF
jgi:hypothetical protein